MPKNPSNIAAKRNGKRASRPKPIKDRDAIGITMPERGNPIVSFRMDLEEREALEEMYWSTRQGRADFCRKAIRAALIDAGFLEARHTPRRAS